MGPASGIRQACYALQLHRSVYYYQSYKDEQAALRVRIKEIAYSLVHYGYRRIHILLQREGYQISVRRVYRLYGEEGLQMRRRRPKRRVQAKVREDRIVPQHANQVWSMDFVSDALFTGEKLKILTIVDAFTKLSPAVGVGFRYKACQVVQTLEDAIQKHGKPALIRIDNGPEFISKELDLWAYAHKITLDFSRPGKPTDNAYIESFNSRFRQECLNQHWFLSLEDAKNKIEARLREYNSHRPHSSLSYKTPEEFVALQQKAAGQNSSKNGEFSHTHRS